MQIISYQAEANLANADHYHLDNTADVTINADVSLNVKNMAAAKMFSETTYDQLNNLKNRIVVLKDLFINNPSSPSYIKSVYNNTN